MSFLNGLWDRIGGLVHASVTQPIDHIGHRLFIASRLLLGAMGLAFVPVYLALYGAPSLWDTALLALLLVPPFTAMIVSTTGRLLLCQVISAAAMLAFAALLGFKSSSLFSVAAVWLILVPLEAMFATHARLILASCIGSIATLVGLHVARLNHWMGAANPSQDHMAALLLIVAVIYAGAVALAGLKIQRERRDSERSNAAQYQALTQAIGDFVIRLDRSGAVTFVSSERFEGPGLIARDVIGRALFERIHVADRPAYLKAVSDAAANGGVAPIELRVRAAATLDEHGLATDPSFAWVEMRLRRLDLKRDRSVMAVLRDISLAKLHAEQLDDALQKAERASHWKDRFLANVSHELRTPLNAIIGFSEILGTEELAPRDPLKRQEYANIIHSSGEHLLAVVNSILDISKIQAGSFDIVSEPFDLAPLIDQCTKMVMLKAQQANISIVQDVPQRLDELVADKRAIKQVLINLLSNAVKFTPNSGTVTISVRPKGNALTISVADTGIGILAKDLVRLGDPFFQARDSYDRPYEGTGLGLSVVRGLVGLHGGELTIESGLGEGTRVTVKLPIDCRQEPEARKGKLAMIETIARGPSTQDAAPTHSRAHLSSNQQVKKIA
ncbi:MULTISPECIES: PAS domain-containing sensor histidine kinase [unclassified Beijerinckia]|uniref:PAS domain-containing sensor histidine kinase n=1 Tax=unclassified Beijerinckia TaxID=2638183 RepID=UPI000896B79E|nr:MULTISPECIES: PAS domain-containing sensor histidine kinase [unclassified Beijerinckia]MDH7796358.1 cell cycle sensor histidine kinase DivJ [Beijerinckia sp. GAS462]SEC41698.1 two-component system, cell cycle sensor histidine kinase DivJ [Beijerinckia sp. 28-YEA-48]